MRLPWFSRPLTAVSRPRDEVAFEEQTEELTIPLADGKKSRGLAEPHALSSLPCRGGNEIRAVNRSCPQVPTTAVVRNNSVRAEMQPAHRP